MSEMTQAYAAIAQAKRGTIRTRLVRGFAALVLLLVVAGVLARRTMTQMADTIGTTLEGIQAESQQSAQLSAAISQTLEAGSRYVETRDPTALEAFRRFGAQAHLVQREMNARLSKTPDNAAIRKEEEAGVIASIDSRFSEIEVEYAMAHRLTDLGRLDEAHRESLKARSIVGQLLSDIERLGRLKAAKVAAVRQRLTTDASRRSAAFVSLIGFAAIIGLIVVFFTVRSISVPLALLVRHARSLSEGDLTVRTTAALPGEFQILANAMNQTGDSLSKVVAVAAETAESVASSAHELASVSEQISLSAGQMASAMTDVSHGAENQVTQLRTVDEALQAIREAADSVMERSAEVNELARDIGAAAELKRVEIDRALGILKDVKKSVEGATREVVALNTTAADINKFVGTVSTIAEQTNLLALNAAIEAARAGSAGRGFAVVADEVRKLAEQSQKAADEIVQMTAIVTARVTSSSRAMEASAARVGEIETVSRDIDAALATISQAAERARVAAGGVTSAAGANADAAASAASGLQSIARTAEGHASAAQQVNASTQEQSAACEEMTSASNHLLEGSTQLRELVGGLRTT
ncbi:MAG: methyl-accepting chemotaxis protein [Gemmatimonadales bacterium]